MAIKFSSSSRIHKSVYFTKNSRDTRSIWAIFIPVTRQAHVWILDRGQNRNVPNLDTLYETERTKKYRKCIFWRFFVKIFYVCRLSGKHETLPAAGYHFDVQVLPNVKEIYRNVQRMIRAYRDEKRGPTLIPFISIYGLSVYFRGFKRKNFWLIKFRNFFHRKRNAGKAHAKFGGFPADQIEN